MDITNLILSCLSSLTMVHICICKCDLGITNNYLKIELFQELLPNYDTTYYTKIIIISVEEAHF